MPERIVISPAGDEVLVFEDDAYCDLVGISASEGGKARTLALRLDNDRRAILQSLWRDGATVSIPSGAAMRVLGERIGLDGRRVATIIEAPIVKAALELNRKAKRTYMAKLVALPDRWHRHLAAWVDEPASAAEVEPFESTGRVPEADLGGHLGPTVEVETEVDATPPASIEVPASPLAGLAPVEIELASAVATALLSQVVDIIATGDTSAPQLAKLALDVKGLEERLGTSSEYVDKLRRQLRDTGDELAAVKHERDGLRQRLRATEHNLRIAVGADAQRIIDVEVRKQVDRVMREPPAGSKVSA